MFITPPVMPKCKRLLQCLQEENGAANVYKHCRLNT